MLHKNFVPIITSWLSRRNRHIVNVYCSTLISDSSPVQQKETVNTAEMKELIVKARSSKVKRKKVLEYIEHSVSHNKEIQDIMNYIQKINPDVTDIIQFMEYGKLEKIDTSTLHLIDKDTAVKYVSLIKNDLSENMCYVAELNPGFGVLTRELLNAGVPLIHLYEGHSGLHKILEIMCEQYPGKLDLISAKNSNIFSMLNRFYCNKITDEKNECDFKMIESRNWEDESYMQIIGASDSKNFFAHIIRNLIFRYEYMFHGRPIFYIAILPSLWHRYNTWSVNNYKVYNYSKVMFNLMFNCELLGTLNRKSFIPWPKKRIYRTSTKPLSSSFNLSIKQDFNRMYVVKLEPKADLYSQLSQKDWITFSYFVRHHMQKRATRVIPALEKWIPDCGIRLIAKDYTIYTQFGDLTPAQILELFKEFKSWPEYKNSHFLNSMNNSVGANHELEFLNE